MILPGPRSGPPCGDALPRAATAADLDRLEQFGIAFHSEDRWSGTLAFDPASFRKTCEALIARGVIFLSAGGLIGLTLGPSIYNHATTVCAELFFWAPDGSGDALRKAAEGWAAERADLLIMSAHEPGPVERIAHWYRRKGYAPIGRQFAKVV